jgi:hypothetical protein
LDPNFTRLHSNNIAFGRAYPKRPLATHIMTKLSGDEGYIAFRVGSGIDRAVAPNEEISHVFFNRETYKVFTGPVWNPADPFFVKCDIPATDSEKEGTGHLDLVF